MKTFYQFKPIAQIAACALISVALCAPLSSCSDDDDEVKGVGAIPELSTPPYENVSAKYEINTAGSAIKSIELTAAGNYIIIADPYAATAHEETAGPANTYATKSGLIPVPFQPTSRSDFNGVIYGKFTKISDTEFILEGFGSIVIEGTSSNTVSIIVTTADGKSDTVSAVKASENPDSAITKAICRTWDLTQARLTAAINGKKIFDKTAPIANYWKLQTEAEKALADWVNTHYPDPEDPAEPSVYDYDFYPSQVLFSRSGTYLVTYTNGAMALSTWRWVNEAAGIFHYSWNYNDANDEEASNDATVSFDGNSIVVSESRTLSEEGITLTTGSIFYGNQAE